MFVAGLTLFTVASLLCGLSTGQEMLIAARFAQGVGGALAMRVLEPDRGLGTGAGADAPGALLVTAGLMTAVYTIVETNHHGWGSAYTIGFAAIAVALLSAFVLRQATAAAPLLPLRVFRSRNVMGPTSSRC